jgi:hypothetical protein
MPGVSGVVHKMEAIASVRAALCVHVWIDKHVPQ